MNAERRKPRLLGISCSLRNARWGAGSQELMESIRGIASEEELRAFLADEAKSHLANFLEAGRADGKPFSDIYANLQRLKGNHGLSNSEAALASALWAAKEDGCEIDHIGLSEVFRPDGAVRPENRLRELLAACDGILISGPVYFGDRGSLAQSLIETISADPELSQLIKGKLYAGIAVGAKRNGGQETTLIYQMLDMLSAGCLAVGNDSDTTAQYGGTVVAGDVGTMPDDDYGLNTCLGTGRRMGRVLGFLAQDRDLAAPARTLFLILQDSDGAAAKAVDQLVAQAGDQLDASVLNLVDKRIKRCIACDICPTEIDVDEVYRCIIRSRNDDLESLHPELLGFDMIVPVLACRRDKSRLQSQYQTFVERTRYLRRGDYVWSDVLVAPLIYMESGIFDVQPLRAVTSFLRHHTVLTAPVVAPLPGSAQPAPESAMEQIVEAAEAAKRLAAGRLTVAAEAAALKYNPVGYVLSADKDLEDERLQKRRELIDSRKERLQRDAAERLR